MIVSFKHKGLKLLWDEKDGSKLPAPSLFKIKMILDAIDRAKIMPEDFWPFPEWRIHALRGNLAGYWSLKVTANYRIIFRFINKKALDIDFIDYH